MPIYEYVCDTCERRFEELRPSSRMDEPASCPSGHPAARRVMSTFAALTRSGNGEAEPVAGGGCGGGCTSCACAV